MNYSSGEKKKLEIARSLLAEQSVLIYDEPTSTLDPNAARIVRGKMKELVKQGKAILLATHNMVEAEKLCDKVIILHKGKVIKEGIPSDLRETITKKEEYINNIIGTLLTRGIKNFYAYPFTHLANGVLPIDELTCQLTCYLLQGDRSIDRARLSDLSYLSLPTDEYSDLVSLVHLPGF